MFLGDATLMIGSDVASANMRWRKRAQWLMPWVPFVALLAWGWRTTDLFHTVPSYGDVLEGLWARNEEKNNKREKDKKKKKKKKETTEITRREKKSGGEKDKNGEKEGTTMATK